MKTSLLSAILIMNLVVPVASADAANIRTAVAEAAAKRAAAGSAAKHAVTKSAKRAPDALRRDRLRDRATQARPLPHDRTAFRYTTRSHAQSERRHGIPPGRHMTSGGGPGRPLSAAQAQRRYGLPSKPEVRETVRLPQGHPVRSNRVVGGAAGVGEATSPKRIPAEAIERVTRLHGSGHR